MDEAAGLSLEQRQPFRAVARFDHGVAKVDQDLAPHRAKRVVVVDEKDSSHAAGTTGTMNWAPGRCLFVRVRVRPPGTETSHRAALPAPALIASPPPHILSVAEQS